MFAKSENNEKACVSCQVSTFIKDVSKTVHYSTVYLKHVFFISRYLSVPLFIPL